MSAGKSLEHIIIPRRNNSQILLSLNFFLICYFHYIRGYAIIHYDSRTPIMVYTYCIVIQADCNRLEIVAKSVARACVCARICVARVVQPHWR